MNARTTAQIARARAKYADLARVHRNARRRMNTERSRLWVQRDHCSTCKAPVVDKDGVAVITALHNEIKKRWSRLVALREYIKALETVNKGMPK